MQILDFRLQLCRNRTSYIPPGLLLLLTLALMLVGAAVARPGIVVTAADPTVGRTLVRFYGVERNATTTYRWSEPLAGVFLYGYEGYPARVALRLAAPRPSGSPPVLVQARSAGVTLGSFVVASDWRRYLLLAPTSPAGETALLLETSAYTPTGDPRELGVALSAVQIAPVGAAGLQPVRTLYLLALPLLGWLLLSRLGTAPVAAVGGGAVLGGVAGWATAWPTLAGYWLPSLGWPGWPALPLLLLAFWPWLKRGLTAARMWATARPSVGWLGLAVALAALVGMRVGLPPAVGMVTLALGVWVGLTLVPAAQHTVFPPPNLPPMGGGVRLPPPAGEGWGGGIQGFQKHYLKIYSKTWLVLLGLLALALFLRLYNLDGQPAGLWRDESRHGLQALRIWSDPSYRPIYVVEGADLPALLFYLMAPVVGLLGPHAWSVRLVSALAGALTPLALAWAAVPLVGRRAALSAAALNSWASWSLSMSRWAFPATLDHLLVLTAVGLVWRCLPAPLPTVEGQTAPRSGGTFWSNAGLALAGLLGGLAVYAYHTGRVAPLALAAVAALRLGTAPAAWRKAAPGLAAAALVAAVTVAPLAAYILGDLNGYNRRVGSVSLLDSNDPYTHTPSGLLLSNLGRYALAYHVSGDTNGRHHMPAAPLLDPVTGLLLAVGLGLALVGTKRRPGLAAACALGAVYLIPGVFSGNAPHAMRALGTLAPACLLAGVALTALTDTVRRWHPRAPAVLGALALGVSLSFNGWLYFGVMRVTPTVYGEFDLLETTLGLVAQAPAAATDPALRAVRVYVPASLRDSDTLRFLTWGLTVEVYTGVTLPAEGSALVLLPASARLAEQTAALAALGPGAVALGATATYPGTDQPIALAFGRGAAAARLLAGAHR